MKRLRLSAKLALAIIPIGLVALLAAGFIASAFLGESKDQNETAHAATVTADAIATLNAVWIEEDFARQVHLFNDILSTDELEAARAEVDARLAQLDDDTDSLHGASRGFFEDVAASVAADVQEISTLLNQVRSLTAPTNVDLLGYREVEDSILALLPKTSSIVSDRVQARELSTAYFLAEGGQVSLEQEQLIEDWRASDEFGGSDTAALQAQSSVQRTLEVLEAEFGAWALRANQTANEENAAILRYTEQPQVNIQTFPTTRNENILTTSEQLANGVAAESSANASDSESEALLVAGIAAVVLIIAIWGAYAVIRSVVRRVRVVTNAATEVSEVDLPALVGALQNPSEDLGDLQPAEIASDGQDEVEDLARSFTVLHQTLFDVAGQQMDILRKGVSEIFVTLARRNRSLVDRQLALLDELESREEDPETLAGYYKLDHLATRMRRNAESLLVLAGTEPTRIWSNPLDISEIIRAALGEVDDYQRVDIMALEPALVSGRAVADIAHLMSELLDNGTQFSSPSDRVRVAGLFDPDGYMLTVSDSGIGMSDARMADLNRLLHSPPVLGLALEPTLGMYVVARLAARHGIKVQLISGAPGLTVRVMLPKELIEVPKADEKPPSATPRPATFLTRPEQPAAFNGSAGGAAQPNRQFADEEPIAIASPNGRMQPDEVSIEEERPSVLPGNIKGKHEQPGRPGGLASKSGSLDQPADQPEPPASDLFVRDHESASEGTDTGIPDKTASGLTRRVPGDSLQTDHFAPHPEAQRPVAPPAQGAPDIDRSEDEPWWVAAEGHKDQRDTAPQASPFENWDSDVAESAEKLEDTGPDQAPALSGAGLPVRTPGTSFKDTDEVRSTATSSDSGAMGIRSALASFEGGRDLALRESHSDEKEDNPPSGGSE